MGSVCRNFKIRKLDDRKFNYEANGSLSEALAASNMAETSCAYLCLVALQPLDGFSKFSGAKGQKVSGSTAQNVLNIGGRGFARKCGMVWSISC